MQMWTSMGFGAVLEEISKLQPQENHAQCNLNTFLVISN